ncbi:Enamine deaminase RidA, house cleaning of reactive enamine intermediates, YjgF/YER057c/UK114 family [Variovorax sp. CF079]|uniref:RidA family protein n=1 Tax=Variovorax sp. CF079 TaxID=1882774 RepID=UPI0008921C06|nr:RidA family protein [Variovorax sp. CF079]SDD33234.1 Enamine deaminase RidA, house cleaning of reactive enamine intermediates, YjgF/YER057c/UK114 family [Variovorax sp. CF079]
MTTLTRSQIADQIAAELGHGFDGEIRIGGHYVSAVRDGRTVYISGQVPRVGSTVMVTGRVGEQVSLDEARKAAQICALRALAILRQTLGSLDAIEKILRIGVLVQCTADFTQQSEVADAASDLMHRVFGEAGVHTRTSVGVYALPKNAAVELDMIVAARDAL